MSEIRVQIPEEVNNKVEQKFFEYNATQNILGYLTSKEGTIQSYLDKYFVIAESKFTELELLKDAVVREYAPDNVTFTSYFFDFHNNCIVYELK